MGEYSRIVKSFDDVDYVLKTNLHGTTRVLEMCRHWEAKIIYSASSSTFGNNGDDQNLSPYAWMKAKIVELIKNYKIWYNINYEICYFFNVYGPGHITTGDYATVIGIFERQMEEETPLTVVSPGTQTRDFTHIEDIVNGVIKAVEANLNGEWHLRSGKSYSILEVAEMFKCKYEIIPERKGERFASEHINTDTNEKLNWKPEKLLDEYINHKINNMTTRKYAVEDKFRKNKLSEEKTSIKAEVYEPGKPTKVYTNIHFPNGFANRTFLQNEGVTHIIMIDENDNSQWEIKRPAND